MNASDVLNFWFEEIDSSFWFKKDEQFDALIEKRFSAFHQAAARGELFSWRTCIEGRLAEIIVLDQFSRNMFRNQTGTFAYDAMALVLAQEAVATGMCGNLAPVRRAFIYMPYMHSESLIIHDEAKKLFAEPGLENNMTFEARHAEIIARFGRYPHRNAILGRKSTPEELVFLQEPGSSF